jgi:hypothetical protein
MRFTPFSQRANILRLRAQPKWPRGLPSWVVNGVVVSIGGEENGCLEVELHPQAVSDLMADLYPQASFVLFSDILSEAKKVGLPVDIERLAQNYGWRLSEDLLETASRLPTLPQRFLGWAHDKGLSLGDFAPLRAVTNLEAIGHFLTHLVVDSPSRSDGARAMEWGVDLHLSGVDLAKLLEGLNTFSEYRERLYETRYPQASARENDQADLAKKLPWPKRAVVRSVRQGDQSGFEVKLFVRSPEELSQQIRGFQAVVKALDHRAVVKALDHRAVVKALDHEEVSR